MIETDLGIGCNAYWLAMLVPQTLPRHKVLGLCSKQSFALQPLMTPLPPIC